MRSARLFAAVSFTPGEKRGLEETTRDFRSRGASGRFVAPELFHITLHFFGQTDLALLPAIEAAMRQTAARHRPFTMVTDRAGSFGRDGRAVLWLGIGQGAKELTALQADLERALAAQGFPIETKPFKAHITVARDGAFPKELSALALPETRLACPAITLMESTAGNGPLRYVPLLTIPLSSDNEFNEDQQ